MKSNVIFPDIVRKYISIYRSFHSRGTYCTKVAENIGPQKKAEDFFFNNEVQKILKKITGLNYNKVFRVRQTEIAPFKYEFVTERMWQKIQASTAERAKSKMQMPPVMDIREPINQVLSKDPELQGYLRSKLVFTDVSPSVSSRERMITVREVDGTLRKATWDERERMNQIYFPMQGRDLETPKLFESPYIERLLEDGSYEFILDSACVQFEPDHPDYHRVTNITYDHIKGKKEFDVLRSTRHFGPMVFYFARNQDINPVLLDMIQRGLISDAADTIKLLNILHCKLAESSKTDETEFIQDYITNDTSSQKSLLERALQAFLEQQSSLAVNASP